MSLQSPQLAADLYRAQQNMFRAYPLPASDASRPVAPAQEAQQAEVAARQAPLPRSVAKAVETQDARAVQAAAEMEHSALSEHPEEASNLRLYGITRNPPAPTAGRFVNTYA